jgi:hypothetical protein
VYNTEETNSTQEQQTMELIIFSPSDNLETLRKAVVGKISRKENGKNLTKAALIAKIEAHNATVTASNQPKPMLALAPAPEIIEAYGPVWAVPVALNDTPIGPVWQFVAPTVVIKAVKRDRSSKPKASKAVKTSPIVGAEPTEPKVDCQPTQESAEYVVTLKEFETLVGSAYATIYRNLGLGNHHKYSADKMKSITTDFAADLPTRSAIWASKMFPISWVSIYIETRKRAK